MSEEKSVVQRLDELPKIDRVVFYICCAPVALVLVAGMLVTAVVSAGCMVPYGVWMLIRRALAHIANP